jgi:Flp pilus assembly pilin Flp
MLFKFLHNESGTASLEYCLAVTLLADILLGSVSLAGVQLGTVVKAASAMF